MIPWREAENSATQVLTVSYHYFLSTLLVCLEIAFKTTDTRWSTPLSSVMLLQSIQFSANLIEIRQSMFHSHLHFDPSHARQEILLHFSTTSIFKYCTTYPLVNTMSSNRAVSTFHTGMRLPIREKPTGLSREETERLRLLLQFKLRKIPPAHIPGITLTDILQRTPRTHITNIPHDINLAFLLRNRALIEQYKCVPQKEDSGQDEAIARAIWFYRLDPNYQFQRYHDTTRWNITLFTAIITEHNLAQQPDRQDIHTLKKQRGSPISRAAARFITLYLAAVLEARKQTTAFTAREAFIRVWRVSPFVLFSHVKPWAQKALKRTIKTLSPEWERELRRARKGMGSDAYDARVAPFVGSLVPGQSDRVPCVNEGAICRDEEANVGCGRLGQNELLDALVVPCPTAARGKSDGAVKQSEDGELVCDLRTAITCLQRVRPKEILPVLMDIFSSADD